MASPIPTIKKSPSHSSSSSGTSYTSSGSESGSPTASPVGAAMPDDFLEATHGDLRSQSREFTRDRDLRKKAYKSKSRTTDPASTPHPNSQLQPPTEEAAGKTKSKKKKTKKTHEKIEKVKKREDRRKSESVLESPTADTLAPSTPTQSRHRRTSSSSSKPKPHRLPSSSSGASGVVLDKSPSPTSPGLPDNAHRRNKSQSVHTQYNVDEGVHERTDDLEAKMAEAALNERLAGESRGGRITGVLEEIDRRQRDRRRDEALQGVVDGAKERFEGKW